jgi:hypothetical protein
LAKSEEVFTEENEDIKKKMKKRIQKRNEDLKMKTSEFKKERRSEKKAGLWK